MGGFVFVATLMGGCTADDPVSSPSQGTSSPFPTAGAPVVSGRSPRQPADVFANVSEHRFVPADRVEERPLREHLRAVAPKAFQAVEVRGLKGEGERLPAAVAVASYDISSTEADSFKQETFTYLDGLDERQEGRVIFDGNGLFFERESIAAATFFVGQRRTLLVHVVGRPPVDIEALAREIYAANI